ncbi:MAG: hypothetical protein HKN67_01275 [Saprospiraceae bacterium]|nr:hypothetical protein [Bacteroidia bacterium]NNF20544.1 hypothetical protein [Saprospiraceae bacterium]NNK90609.1 hypothetical protein [Saprospiraceae bacterium]
MQKSFLFSLLLIVTILSCGEDTVKTSVDILAGKWNIHEAYRDGRETQTLKKGYFEFSTDQKLKTNILQDTLFYPYKLSGNKIKLEDAHKISYTVMKLTSDSLILETKIRKFDFRILLLKKGDEELPVQ